MVVVEKEKAV